jgi:hypothetical protein
MIIIRLHKKLIQVQGQISENLFKKNLKKALYRKTPESMRVRRFFAPTQITITGGE